MTLELRARSAMRATAMAVAVLASVLSPKIASASSDPELVPISWAIDLRHGSASNVAVAVPCSLDYRRVSLRSGPLFRIFPHISLLGKANAQSPSLSGNPLFAMGGGISLVNAFAVGVGLKVSEPLGHAYVMAGLSLTDLLKLAW